MRESALIEWLSAGDPAVRWQVLRDLCGADPGPVRQERSRVAGEGWGTRLLRRQDESTLWAGGVYNPKWTSTTYTLLLLRDCGLDPQHERARKACALLLDRGFAPDGGIDLAGSVRRSETCLTGMVLALAAYFQLDDPRLDRVAEHLLEHQLEDRGWNCRAWRGERHSSFHTTILVLEALREYENFRPAGADRVRRAQAEGREFLLVHRLFRSHRTGEVVHPRMTRFAFPPRWHYDILRALDYFRACAAPRDERLEDAMEIVVRRRRADGRWNLPAGYPGRTWFEMEKAGQPSRWNTLRALRVLRWWEGTG